MSAAPRLKLCGVEISRTHTDVVLTAQIQPCIEQCLHTNAGAQCLRVVCDVHSVTELGMLCSAFAQSSCWSLSVKATLSHMFDIEKQQGCLQSRQGLVADDSLSEESPRIATALFYLKDTNLTGGETAFPVVSSCSSTCSSPGVITG